jgi:hypothetical protein
MSERIEIPNTKITLYGSKNEIKRAMSYFNEANIRQRLTDDEYSDRLMLMNEFVPYIKCSITYDGNTVWNKEKLIRDFRKILNNGMKSLSDYLYGFFHLDCGSIAHFNKQGWITTFPTMASLKQFFEKNEYGQPVIDHMPHWKADAIEIVKEMVRLLKEQQIKLVKCKLCNTLVGDTPHDYEEHIFQNHTDALRLRIREWFYTDLADSQTDAA